MFELSSNIYFPTSDPCIDHQNVDPVGSASFCFTNLHVRCVCWWCLLPYSYIDFGLAYLGIWCDQGLLVSGCAWMHPCRCGRPLAGPKKLSWENNNRKLWARFANLIFTCWSRYSLEMFLIMSSLCISAITLICLSEEPGVDKQLCSSMDSRNWGLYHTRLGLRLSLDDICMWTYIYMCVFDSGKNSSALQKKNMTAVLPLGAMISSPFITNKPPRSQNYRFVGSRSVFVFETAHIAQK